MGFMCGRYTQFRDLDDVVQLWDIDQVIADLLDPSWNVAPTQPVYVAVDRVLDGARSRELHTARWGLVPSWAKDVSIGARMINARSETITAKPVFRSAAAKRRAVLPADGYYEWTPQKGGSKRANYLHDPEDQILGFAGLYEWWRPKGSDEPWLLSTTIITRPATDELGHVHDRCPVIVPVGMLDDWLAPALTDPADVDALLAIIPEPHLAVRPVGPAVGNVRSNSASLIEPA